MLHEACADLFSCLVNLVEVVEIILNCRQGLLIYMPQAAV